MSRRVKGCWVCGEDHFARDHHSGRDVRAALQRHRKQGRAYVAIDDVVQLCADAYQSEDDAANAGDADSMSSSDTNDDGDGINFGLTKVNTIIEETLSNRSFQHGITIRHEQEMNTMEAELNKPEDYQPEFRGIMCDTGANRSSVMSIAQYKAYCREHLSPAALQTPPLIAKEKRQIHGLAGSEVTLGYADIVVPITGLGISPTIRFHILRSNAPTVWCLRDMKRVGVEISIQKNCLILRGREHQLVLKNDLLWLRWDPDDYILYTADDLRKLHRSFGHPSARALTELLKKANPTEPCVRDALEQIAKNCLICAKHARKPHRFKLTIGTEEYRFNHTVAADILEIEGKKILHCVDESTHFGSASILPSMKSADVWKALLKCWSLVYLGPPDFLRVDQGSNFVSEEFKASAIADGIKVVEAPVESPETMSHVERYHGPLRAAYLKIKAVLKRARPPEILELAIKSVNYTTGPEGLCPTLLVFGAIPKPARPGIAPTQVERARAVDSAMREVSKVHARSRVQFGLRHKGPTGGERKDLDDLFPGTHVLVYRKKSKSWEGPFTFIDKIGETVCIQLPYGRRIFRSTVVKPAPPQTSEDSMHLTDSVISNGHDFSAPRASEIEGLFKRKVFKIVDRTIVPKGTRIYKPGWVNKAEIQDDGNLKLRSRMVARNFRDAGSATVPTRSPTISRWGPRLLLCLASIMPEKVCYLRDISQAYCQSEGYLKRDIFLEAPIEMKLPPNQLLKVVKPLYGIPESGLYWYETYHLHHTSRLSMIPAKGDPCFLFRNTSEANLPNIVVLQVDDSFGVGDEQFLEDEQREVARFDCKPRVLISVGTTAQFNGVSISRNTTSMYEMAQVQKLNIEKVSNGSKLVSLRAKLQYVATCTRPDIASPVQLLASSVTKPTDTTFKKMNEVVDYCKRSGHRNLKYINLDVGSLRLLLFTDAAFANASNQRSQLGFILLLADKFNKCNIVHYGSVKCRRVARSVMAAEVMALVYGFDASFVVKHTLDSALGRDIPLDAYVDSRTTFNTIAKSSNTLEKRLQIDVSSIRESHKKGEMRTIGWIPGDMNPADGLTRNKVLKDSHPLCKIMDTNMVEIKAHGWASTAKENM